MKITIVFKNEKSEKEFIIGQLKMYEDDFIETDNIVEINGVTKIHGNQYHIILVSKGKNIYIKSDSILEYYIKER